MSKLLIAEHPLQVLPTLAVTIGLNEAILLQQLHYWLNRSDHARNGRRWVHKTVSEWQTEMPFWCERTIKTVLKSLRDRGLIQAVRMGGDARDRTLWYSIDYEALDALTVGVSNDQIAPETPVSLPDAKGKSCTMEGANFAPSDSANAAPCKRTETTTEITTEIKTKAHKPKLVLPDWLSPVDWQAFLDHRKRLRSPMAPEAQRRAISALEKLRADGDDPAAVIDQSIVNDWKGFFPLRRGNTRPSGRAPMPTDDFANKVYSSTPDDELPDWMQP